MRAADDGWVRIQVVRTRGRAFRRSSCRTSSTASVRPIRPARAKPWGLGIGLSIAKHLVELHGGSIEASSPGLNQGATFVVQLPVMQSERALADDGDDLAAPSVEIREKSGVS